MGPGNGEHFFAVHRCREPLGPVKNRNACSLGRLTFWVFWTGHRGSDNDVNGLAGFFVCPGNVVGGVADIDFGAPLPQLVHDGEIFGISPRDGDTPGRHNTCNAGDTYTPDSYKVGVGGVVEGRNVVVRHRATFVSVMMVAMVSAASVMPRLLAVCAM